MSEGHMIVKFPDGEIKWGTYYGTSDTIGWTLYDETDYEYKKERDGSKDDPLPLEDVCVVPLYGTDKHFYTKASRNFLHPVILPFIWGNGLEYGHEEIKGLPDWYIKYQEGRI